jgi:signal transduction histidine kinase/CheY-like chemotaxis protein
MKCNFFEKRRFVAWPVSLMLTLAAYGAAHAAPKNILIVYSFSPNASPYYAITSAFQTALTRELQEPVDIYAASLDSDRFTEPQDEEAYVQLLQKRFAKRHIALIVPIGSPAAHFVAQYREQFSPGTPVVAVEVDPRLTDSEALHRNATVVRQDVRPAGMIEDMLKIAPDTANIAVIFGDSPLERFWANVCRRDFQAFENRVNFIRLDGLSLDEVEKRVSKLPPHSFVFLGLFIRDVAGVSFDGYEPLRRLHAAANAPIYGYFQSQLGFGIIGGRLNQNETMGSHAAAAAARLLRGEPAANIPEEVLPTASPVYDWRELKRWGISEAQLPAGSSIRFREPTFWERYRWYITGAGLLALIELLLIVGLLTNLARRRRAEMEMRRLSQELALFSRAATMSELAASIAHEINQPLAAILSNAQAALRLMEHGAADLTELREIFSDIAEDDQRAAEVIRTMRSMLRKSTAEHQPLLLNDLIENVVALVRNEALVRKVSVFLDLGLRPAPIQGDRVQLQQVILNLVVNAFDAMETSALPRKLTLRTRETGAEAVLDVADSGSGIAAGKLDSIFEPFYTTKASGLGMGLSLSRSIVIAHNGRLWAENNPDGGATIHMALPTGKSMQPAVKRDTNAASRSDGEQRQTGCVILLVDDKESFRRAVSSILAALPQLKHISEAADGEEALEKAAAIKPDLVMLDIGLPVINGLEVAGRMQTIAPGCRLLFLTQYDSPDFVRAALRAGALGYILKTDAGSELLPGAMAVLRGDQYLSSGIRHCNPANA